MKYIFSLPPDSLLRLVIGTWLLLVGWIVSTPSLAAVVPDNIVYNAVTREYEPALSNSLTIRRGQSFRVTIKNLNPLYRLKTTQEQIIVSYLSSIPLAFSREKGSLPGLIDKCDLSEFTKKLIETEKTTNKLLANFVQVRAWAGTTALDEQKTKNALTEFTKDFSPVLPIAGTGKISVPDLETATSLWADLLSRLTTTATEQAKVIKANKCGKDVQQGSDQLVQRAQQLQARFNTVATSEDLARLALYWTILRDVSYEQQSGPVQVQGDRVLLTVDVAKRDDFTELPPPQWDVLALTVHAVGFITMDISAGLLLNGLRDRSYSLRDSIVNVRDTLRVSTRYKRVQENKSAGLRPGLVSLLHVRYKVAPDFSTGPSFGLTVTDTKSVLQYHAGWSFLFGDRQRIVLTAGWSGGEVRRIREDFTIGGRVPANMTEVPTRMIRDNSLMIAVTYNITSTLTKLVQTADK
jgi:hypothetical protein